MPFGVFSMDKMLSKISGLVLTIVLSYYGSGLAIPTFQTYTVALFNVCELAAPGSGEILLESKNRRCAESVHEGVPLKASTTSYDQCAVCIGMVETAMVRLPEEFRWC
jgi:hypothetical protein